MDEETVYQIWVEYLKPMTNQIIALADQYPEERTMAFDFQKIFKKSGDLAEALLDDPEMVIRVGEAAIQSFMEPDQKIAINLRITNLFPTETIKIKNIRSNNLSKLISVNGVVKKSSPVKAKLIIGVFRCSSCGFEQEIIQDIFQFTEPLECNKKDGGCGKRSASTTFKFVMRKSLFIDAQAIQIESRGWGTEQPTRITVILEDDLVGDHRNGDTINIIGIVKGRMKKEQGAKSTNFDWYLIANNLINKNKDRIEELEADKKTIKQFKEIAGGNPIDWIASAICPSIKGYNDIKRTLALALIGGVSKKKWKGDGWTRGDMHILLVGDPGTAKSQIIKRIAELGLIGYYVSGKNASGPGLTAAVVPDDFSGGKWTIDAGLMVLGDLGIVSIDEMDKMTKDDRNALNEAMETQIVSVAKAGVNATMKARTTVCGACNPKGGKFKPGVVASQIDMDLALLSRFIFIWQIVDEPNPEKDFSIAMHIYDHGYNEPDPNEIDETELIRKYIHYVKKIIVNADPEMRQYMAKFYSEFRSPSTGTTLDDQSTVTTRVAEDIRRVSEAIARCHMRDNIIKSDVNMAVDLLKKSLRQVTAGADGEIDMGVLLTGRTKSQRMMIADLVQFLRDSIGDKQSISLEKFISDVTHEYRLSRVEVQDYLGKLKEQGEIYYPRAVEDLDQIGLAVRG